MEPAYRARLASWASVGATDMVWRKAPGFWPEAPATDVVGRLGWLQAPELAAALVTELRSFVEEVMRDGVEHVVLLGMGGSSLAAEVLARVIPREPQYPELTVLDSTHPTAVRACAEACPPKDTLYLVSSKSGTTLEPNAFFRLFWEKVSRNSASPGQRFVAITDPGTPLEQLAKQRQFRRCFAAPADVGGRYSALTVFGLVPGALVGADIAGVLATARAMAAECMEAADLVKNPGLRLGAALGELARAGRDKVVFCTTRSLRPFPAWTEQLLAESLGKLGRGIVPVARTPPRAGLPSSTDVVLIHVALEGEDDVRLERELARRESEGVPVLRFRMASPLDLGQEFFRWEYAVAACGAVIEVDPFDQPDVEHAKELAREAMAPPTTGRDTAAYGVQIGRESASAVERWLTLARPGDYVAVQAFLPPNRTTDAALERLASRLCDHLGAVVTVGYGPRFLHSTGQLHKGGPPSGLFLQIVDEPTEDVAVPELGLTFGTIIRAQARGDRGALEEKARRVLVVNAGDRPTEALAGLVRQVGRGSPAGPAPA